MKIRSKIILFVLFLAGCTLCGYLLWLSMRPVDIVAVHKDGSHSYVLVRNFPFTLQGKIDWWLNNKDILKRRYNIPEATSHGGFIVIFWLFGEGYKENEKYDRLCFNDMQTKENCIDKNRVFSVENGRNDDIWFTVDDGVYRMKKNGKIDKISFD